MGYLINIKFNTEYKNNSKNMIIPYSQIYYKVIDLGLKDIVYLCEVSDFKSSPPYFLLRYYKGLKSFQQLIKY